QAGPFTAEEIEGFERLAARVSAALREPDAADIRRDQLARIDAVDEMLPVISSALDVREVFHRLSEVAKSVLPDDVAMGRIISEDHVQASLYALDGISREAIPEVVSTNWVPFFSEHFQYSIQDDQPSSVLERQRPTARAGLRSTLRVPLSFNGRVGGAVE